MAVHYREAPSGNNNVTADFDYNVIVDEKIHHASVGPYVNRPGSGYGYIFLPPSRLGPNFFTLSNMIERSK